MKRTYSRVDFTVRHASRAPLLCPWLSSYTALLSLSFASASRFLILGNKKKKWERVRVRAQHMVLVCIHLQLYISSHCDLGLGVRTHLEMESEKSGESSLWGTNREQTLGKQSANHFRLSNGFLLCLLFPDSHSDFGSETQDTSAEGRSSGQERRMSQTQEKKEKKGEKASSSSSRVSGCTKCTVREMISDPRAAHDTRSRLYVSQQSGNNGNSIQSGLEGMRGQAIHWLATHWGEKRTQCSLREHVCQTATRDREWVSDWSSCLMYLSLCVSLTACVCINSSRHPNPEK